MYVVIVSYCLLDSECSSCSRSVRVGLAIVGKCWPYFGSHNLGKPCGNWHCSDLLRRKVFLGTDKNWQGLHLSVHIRGTGEIKYFDFINTTTTGN